MTVHPRQPGVCEACFKAGANWSDTNDNGNCYECNAPIDTPREGSMNVCTIETSEYRLTLDRDTHAVSAHVKCYPGDAETGAEDVPGSEDDDDDPVFGNETEIEIELPACTAIRKLIICLAEKAHPEFYNAMTNGGFDDEEWEA